MLKEQAEKYTQEKDLLLAFDPGRDKTGYAFTDLFGELILSGIFETGERENFFDGLKFGRIDNVIEKNLELFPSGLLEIKSACLPEHEEVTADNDKNILSHVKFIAIGNGTNSRNFVEHVKNFCDKIECVIFSERPEVIIVDEKYTTLEARSLYWKIHKPGFLMKFIPEGLRVPARVLDDLAAWAIALRTVKKYRDISANKL